MAELEKVLKGLECCIGHGKPAPRLGNEPRDCENCPYARINGINNTLCFRHLQRDALELLKAQEAIKPYIDYDGQDVWRCGKCGNSLMHPSYYESDEDAKNHIRYCSHCGREVKWNG